MSRGKLETRETPTHTRERILAATWRLMETRHGQGVRMEDVAHAACVSRQAVYLHFASRAELLVATVRYVDETLRLNERLEEVYAAPRGVDALEAYVAFWGHYIPDIYGLAKALLAVRATDGAAAAAWEDRMAGMRAGCRAIIECLERQGALAPGWSVDDAAAAFWALLSIAVWEDLTITCGWTLEQYVRHMREVLTRTFVSEG